MDTPTPVIPSGSGLGARPLNFYVMCDCSGSMSGNKIQQLNTALRELIPYLRKVADDNPNATVYVNVIAFSDGAEWLTAEAIRVDHFSWTDMPANGQTAMGTALGMVADRLENLPQRGLPPVCVLISDGQPNDDFVGGLNKFNAVPWAKKAVRQAIAIGDDCDRDVLQRFLGPYDPERKNAPIEVKNIDQLVKQIRLKSTAAVKDAAEQAMAIPTQPSSIQAPAQAPAQAAAPAPALKDADKAENWVF